MSVVPQYAHADGFTQTGGTCTNIPTTVDKNCSGHLRTLNESEYQDLGNNTVLFNSEVVEILRTSSLGQPVICKTTVSLDCPVDLSLLSLNDSQEYKDLGNNSIVLEGEVKKIVFSNSGTLFVCVEQNGSIQTNITVTPILLAISFSPTLAVPCLSLVLF